MLSPHPYRRRSSFAKPLLCVITQVAYGSTGSTFFHRCVVTQVMKDARIRAHDQPIRLGKNWVLGALFILLWIVLLCWGTFALCTGLPEGDGASV